MVRMIIGVLILLSTLSLIMVRPRRVTEAIAAAGGGALCCWAATLVSAKP